ncbi:hypothetical protein RsoPWF2_33 [Ralstonia phage vRsoP-WF2]|uniref:Uncharacterized protein n=1 Tax=Ralstonia phage DU_RP_I TaxID=2041493 RepID=A0A2D2W503_9CAUD|nr:hypothetical protein HOS41_gp20 [Ralstonia phage DU_RP_I]ATS93381.1 hypothetical protein R1B41kb_p020 [Ralstonia phage DU_RP_I]UHX60272.1 hypothetical protein RsoPWF2_33 [Ralstonia phage vRsoP-WF2]UHX60324.1 hypothetical protein RsoPWM2_33 [Ralstonia phage vRsoP-WM2]UHX60377.1 hypothetical protein RsoPWR2_34 [Ralstonia phage vRsoP-WR2]
MSQSRKGSLIEALINTAIGFGINFTANLIILPLFGFTSLTVQTNLVIGVVYTLISVVRSYVVRRWFNAHIVRAAKKLSGA